MTKRKLTGIIIIAFLVISVLIRSFTPRRNFDSLAIRLRLNVAADHEVHMLLKIDPKDKYYHDNATPEQQKTELYKYNEDGWRCADYFVKNVSYLGRITEGDSAKYFDVNDHVTKLSDFKYFVPHFKSFKAAECDKDGNIIRVLDEVSMISKNREKYYYIYNLNYLNSTDLGTSVTSNENASSLWGLTINEIDDLNDFSNQATFIIWAFFNWFVLVYFIILRIISSKGGDTSPILYAIVYFLLSGFHIALTISDFIMAWLSFVTHCSDNNIIGYIPSRFFFITLPWAFVTWLFLKMRKRDKQLRAY